MAGPHPAKFELEDVQVYIHVKDEASGANVTHIDVDHPALAEIIEPDENSFVGGKDGGVFIGLKDGMIERAEEYVEERSNNLDRERKRAVTRLAIVCFSPIIRTNARNGSKITHSRR